MKCGNAVFQELIYEYLLFCFNFQHNNIYCYTLIVVCCFQCICEPRDTSASRYVEKFKFYQDYQD